MSSTNQSPQYQKAQGKFLAAQTNEEKLEALEEMIRECPKHKSSEKMLANLKTRYKKLKGQLEKIKKSGKGKKQGIKKEDMQAVIVGFTNTGKSTLLKRLTNASPEVASYEFTTKESTIGMMNYSGTQIQTIEIPAVNSEYYDKGTVNEADAILILVKDLNQIKDIEKRLDKAKGKKIVVFNFWKKCEESLRKISATLKSKKYNFVILTEDPEAIEELKEKTFVSFDRIRIYTKEPGKSIDEVSDKPVVLKKDSTVKDVAEKILKGFSKNVKEIRIWGPSSKFPNQKVGLTHVLKDLDIVEFKTN